MSHTVESRLMSIQREIERMAINHGDGADLFQDVAIACVEQRGVAWSDDDCCRLIRRIARNKKCDGIRRLKYRRHEPLREDEAPAKSPDRFEDLVDGLSPDDQRLIRGRFQAGKSFVELAPEFQCSDATLRARWRQLKLQLRHELNDSE